MEHKRTPSLEQIIVSHSWKRSYERYLPLSRYVFRPIGFLLTWLSIRLGFNSEAISWLSGMVGAAGLLCLSVGGNSWISAGIAILILFNLLDCVDGSSARTMHTENPYGKFLDSFLGSIVDMAFWAVIGITAYNNQDLLYFTELKMFTSAIWIFIGGLTCYLHIMTGYIEGIFETTLRDDWNKILIGKKRDSNKLTKKDKLKPLNLPNEHEFSVRKLTRILIQNLRVRETHYLFLILAAWYSIIDLFLLVYMHFYLVNLIFLIFVYCRRGGKVKELYLAID